MTTPHHAGSVVLKEDLVTRLAFLTGTYEVEDEGGYVAADENGNFGGGIPDRKLNLLGFVLHHAAVGFNFGIMSGAAYPVMQSYLNASGEVVSSASVLIMMPWSFKVFYGMLINCVPVWGLRRKSWMLIGWMVCLGMLLTMTFVQWWCSPILFGAVGPRDQTQGLHSRNLGTSQSICSSSGRQIRHAHVLRCLRVCVGGCMRG